MSYLRSCTSVLRSPFRLSITFQTKRTFTSSIAAMAQEFKLKGLTSLDLKNGQKQEVEVEGIENGKVLLVKHDNQVHALNPNCTHYGAPLMKGVVTGDGRITCPWHGACFKIATGDVEDAPALDPLHRFDVLVKDGGVFIKGQESQIKEGRRTLKFKTKTQSKGQEKVVIVGRGSGATGAMEALRSEGFDGPITTIATEDYRPIDRTKLSKALITDLSKVAWRSEEFYKDAGIENVTDSVTSIDFDGKKVKTESGKEHEYTKLILSTGGIAKFLPMPGLKGDLDNVFVIRQLNDAQKIMSAAGSEGGKKIVVIGSSFIGMEVANCLASQKHEVHVIGMESQPMENVLGAEVGKVCKAFLEKNGVKFHLNASVEKGAESEKNKGKIGKVILKDGPELEADLVVEGVGIRPSTDYLKDNKSVQLEKDASVSVDSSFALKGIKDVFAIGDIATYPYHGPGGGGKPVRIEHWDVAQNMGRSVASTIAKGTQGKSFIPVFWSAVGSQLRYCGNTMASGYDDVVIQGNTDTSEGKQSFVAYYCSGDEVVAVASMMKDPYMTQSAELMRRGKMPKKSELQKGVDITEISVPGEVKI